MSVECACDLPGCYDCIVRRSEEDERRGTSAVRQAVEQLADAIADYPQAWNYGDGCGGWVALKLSEALERRGWFSEFHPRRPKPLEIIVGERDGWQCRYCATDLAHNPFLPSPTLDHVLPKSRGGKDDPNNLVLCCASCNSRKGARTPSEWLQAMQEGQR